MKSRHEYNRGCVRTEKDREENGWTDTYPVAAGGEYAGERVREPSGTGVEDDGQRGRDQPCADQHPHL